ncbi:hypothetical protein A3F86_03365, partial [candidate division WOR-1 bacterium RIFCSPLOWO2_12_FULL_45_9]
MKKLYERGKLVVSPVLSRYFPEFEVKKGSGCYLFGTDNKKYLDFSAGIAVCSTGHCHARVVAAAKKQLGNLIHICIGVANYDSYITLAEKLNKIVPIKNAQFFFCQSGSEAVEAAIKLARYSTKKPGLVALKGSFHGRTFGALSLTTSKMKYRDGYEPLVPNVYIAEPDLTVIEGILKNNEIAGLIFEPILGEGGYVPYPPEFILGLRQLTEKYGVLLIADEIQSGMGRTGKWFVLEHFDVTPDILCISKALASGFPLGAIAASAELMSRWSPGSHGGTFGGNPVCCAAAIATVDVMQKEKLLQNARQLGSYSKKKLAQLQKKHPIIKDIRGLGLMIGIDFKDSAAARKI